MLFPFFGDGRALRRLIFFREHHAAVHSLPVLALRGDMSFLLPPFFLFRVQGAKSEEHGVRLFQEAASFAPGR